MSVEKNSEEDQEGTVSTLEEFMLLGTSETFSAANYIMIRSVWDEAPEEFSRGKWIQGLSEGFLKREISQMQFSKMGLEGDSVPPFFQPDSWMSCVHLAVPSSSPATYFITEYSLSPFPPLLLPRVRFELFGSYFLWNSCMKLLKMCSFLCLPDAGIWFPEVLEFLWVLVVSLDGLFSYLTLLVVLHLLWVHELWKLDKSSGHSVSVESLQTWMQMLL